MSQRSIAAAYLAIFVFLATQVTLPPKVALAAAYGAAWTQLTQAGPPNGLIGGFAYDDHRDRAVFFGGQYPTGLPTKELWEFDGSGWRQVSDLRIPWPSARWGQQMAYFPDLGQSVMFSGGGVAGNAAVYFPETWEWDGTAWTQLSIPQPPARAGGAMVYDGTRHVLIMFGGSNGSSTLNDTWTFDGRAWTNQAPVHTPGARYFTSMAFDSLRGQAVLFGGFGSSGRFGDTWEWDGFDWNLRSPTNSPLPRLGAGMGYDLAHARTMLFGGDRFNFTNNIVNDNQTWEWDGTTWTLDLPSAAPAPAQFYQMVYDSMRQRLLAYGGDQVGAPDVLFHDTWSITAAIVATSVGVTPTTAVYGGSASLRATVTTASGAPAQGQVTFSIAGGPPAAAHTDISGVAAVTMSLAGLPVGVAPVSAPFVGDSGFANSFGSGGLSVNQAPLNVAVSDSSRLYGQSNPAFSATFDGLVNGDAPGDLGTPTFSTDASPSSPVGSYAVQAAGLAASNYQITYLAGTLQVLKAPLTITADDATRPYGAPNPAFMAQFTGLVNGDLALSFGSPAFSTAAAPASPVGAYPISVGGVTAPNYSVTYAAGTLAVVRATVAVVQNDPGTWDAGQTVVLRVQVFNTAAGALAVSGGSVEFRDVSGHVLCGGVPVADNFARCRIRPLSVGSHTYSASYSGTVNLAGAITTLHERVVANRQ